MVGKWVKSFRSENESFLKFGEECVAWIAVVWYGILLWYFLDHLVDALRAIGGLAIFHCRVFENFYEIFKSFYQKSSKRHVSAQDKAVSYQSQTFVVKQMS